LPDANLDTATINTGDEVAVIWETEDGPASIKIKVLGFQTADPAVAYTVVGQQQ
jgi:hypothetical protein